MLWDTNKFHLESISVIFSWRNSMLSPKFGSSFPTHSRERNGIEELHSQLLGTGTGMQKFIPSFWEREWEWKIHSQLWGTGMEGWCSREWSGTGIPAHPWVPVQCPFNNFHTANYCNLHSIKTAMHKVPWVLHIPSTLCSAIWRNPANFHVHCDFVTFSKCKYCVFQCSV